MSYRKIIKQQQKSDLQLERKIRRVTSILDRNKRSGKDKTPKTTNEIMIIKEENKIGKEIIELHQEYHKEVTEIEKELKKKFYKISKEKIKKHNDQKNKIQNKIESKIKDIEALEYKFNKEQQKKKKNRNIPC